MNETIQIDRLVTDGLQIRAALDRGVIAEYAEILRDGGELPPVTVVRDVFGDCRLVDGFHRVEAAKSLGRTEIEAEILNGDETEALRQALRANATHGLRRTNADKRKALETAWEHRIDILRHEPSVRELAALCGVSVFLSHDFIEEKRVLENNTPPKACREDATKRGDAEVPVDRYGTVVPEKLVGAFNAAKTRAMLKTLREMQKAIEAEKAAGNYAFSRVSQSTVIALKNAEADLRLEMPYCVCRQCQGRGCRACGQIGVQTRREYDLNPREVKA